ncbi:MAG: glycosyltransferase family 87 protein, partial [Myxococcales bacterium]
FLFVPNDVYSDLTLTWRQSQAANPYINNGTGVSAVYFPFVYSVLKVPKGMSRETVILGYVALTLVATVGVWLLWLRKQWRHWSGDSRRPVVVMLSLWICVCNYPLLIALDRGNTDPITMALAFLACELALARRSALGALSLALGAASKAFPLAAILVLLRRRQYLSVLLASGALIALVLGPLALLPGPFKASFQALLDSLAAFRRSYVLGSDSCHYSSDWLNAWRALALYKSWNSRIAEILPWYERGMLVWAGVLATLSLFVLRDWWRELLAIGVIIVVFPNVTNDYKLVFLLPGILHWLSSNASGWRNQVFLASSALLLLPKHFWFLIPGHGTSISCLINPVLVTAMSVVLWPTPYERILASERLRGLWPRVFGRKPLTVRG